MRKTIVETLFSLNYKNKLFEKKNLNRIKVCSQRHRYKFGEFIGSSVTIVIKSTYVILSVFSVQITVIRVAREYINPIYFYE